MEIREKAAKMAHEVNRIWCNMNGDFSQPSWESAPDWQKQSAIAGVEAIMNNPMLTPEMSHENWMNHKLEDGWKYGLAKNEITKEHPCLVPYEMLPPDQKAKDHLFTGVVRLMLSVA